jgi:hypothetical protein
VRIPLSSARHLLTSLALLLAITRAVVAYGQTVEDNKAPQQSSGGAGTVTHNEPPATGDEWSSGKMRKAKPFPMPSVKGPPVPQQATPTPYTEPPGSSSPGIGGPAPR